MPQGWIEPLGDRIIIRPIDESESKYGSIIIPDVAKERPMFGEVLAVGPGKYSQEAGMVVAPKIESGDVVLFSKYAGTELEIWGDDIIVMSSEDVFGVRREGEESEEEDG